MSEDCIDVIYEASKGVIILRQGDNLVIFGADLAEELAEMIVATSRKFSKPAIFGAGIARCPPS